MRRSLSASDEQAAANLNQPNVVGVYDWGQEAGTYYIVMEYVEGRSLAEIIRAEVLFTLMRAADIATGHRCSFGFRSSKRGSPSRRQTRKRFGHHGGAGKSY